MSERFWLPKATRLARRVNLAWWLQRFLPLLLGASAVHAAVLLAARRAGWSVAPLWLAWGAVVAALGLYALHRVRPRFHSRRDALARLDFRGGLASRLSSAAEGIGPWPEPASEVDAGLRWRTPRLLGPPTLAIGILGAAAWLPLPPPQAQASFEVAEPLAWSQVEAAVEELEAAEIVEEAALEELEQRVETLRSQPVERWYDHPSLEAADTLREQVARSLSQLEQDLGRTDRILGELEALEFPSAQTLRELGEAFGESRARLEAGDLLLRPDLMTELRDIDPKHLRQLSEAEIRRLRGRLERGASACQGAAGRLGQGSSPSWAASATRDGANGSPGRGGVTRGPGSAPVALRPEEPRLGASPVEELPASSLEHAALGERVGSRLARPETAPEAGGTAPGGALASPGEGGAAVWRSELPPHERERLKRYFE